MFRRILPFLIFGSFIVTFADSAIQTDWSGGPGVVGPVIDWGDQFYLATYVEWGSIPDDISLQLIIEHTIDGNFEGACSVYSEDIDGDGDMDVLGAALYDNDITWWENIDGFGTSWAEHIVDGNFNGVYSIYAVDIDGDGDIDVLGAAFYDDDITWWENIDGLGTSWTKHTIDWDFDGARSVYSEDINGDGYMDIIGAAYESEDISWWENVDGSGRFWVEHTVDSVFETVCSIYSEDIDGDGDMDILGAAYDAYYDYDISWWENIYGLGIYWVEHTIDWDFDGARSVYSEDIDGDGDMDVLGAAFYDDDITWWENIDGSGTIWTEHTVNGNFNGAYSVYAEDIDGDGDMDILGAAYLDHEITCWENVGGSGILWAEYTVTGDFDGAWSVYSEDIDGDGNMDVLGAALNDYDIIVWDLNSTGMLESSILDTQEDTNWDYLDWNSQIPLGTSISFLVRASNDYTNMGSWSDTLTSPCLLEGFLNDGDKYVQYMAILKTSNPFTTPTLNDITINWDPLSIGDTAEPIPAEIELLTIAPNPVAGSPIIRFTLPKTAFVDISVFDLSGRLVAEVIGYEYSPGFHDVLLCDLSTGIYFCSMISGEFAATQRFVIIE